MEKNYNGCWVTTSAPHPPPRTRMGPAFINAFSPTSCSSAGSLGCIASSNSTDAAGYEKVTQNYRLITFNFASIYQPSVKPARSYGYVSSNEDFADSYAIVTIGSYGEFNGLEVENEVLIKTWIDQ